MESVAFLPPSLCGANAFHGRALRQSSNHSVGPRTRRPETRVHRLPVAQLEKRKLGSSDLEVTDICLGTMTWGIQNTEKDAFDQLDYAIKERGINFLDTAEIYPVPTVHPKYKPGLTEDYIGRWLESNPSLREKIVIATKVAGRAQNSAVAAARHPERKYEEGKYPDAILDKKNVLEACDASLRRLKTDYIDLYQLHWPDRYVPLFGSKKYDHTKERESIAFKETLSGLKQLLDQGKIRAYGVSNETTYGVAEIVRAADELGMPRPVSIQNNFCLLNRTFETELAEACAPSNYNISLMPYSILAGGVLTGKYVGKVREDGEVVDPALKTCRFGMFPGFMKRYTLQPVSEAIEGYQRIADEAGISMTALAQAFCKTRPFIASSIIGATNLDQLKENVNAFETTLDEDILTAIDRLHESNKDVGVRDSTLID